MPKQSQHMRELKGEIHAQIAQYSKTDSGDVHYIKNIGKYNLYFQWSTEIQRIFKHFGECTFSCWALYEKINTTRLFTCSWRQN